MTARTCYSAYAHNPPRFTSDKEVSVVYWTMGRGQTLVMHTAQPAGPHVVEASARTDLIRTIHYLISTHNPRHMEYIEAHNGWDRGPRRAALIRHMLISVT